MKKYLLWATKGYRTYDGQPAADIGGQTRDALMNFCDNPIIPNGAEKEWSAGNGPIMRLAPVVIANTFLNKEYGDKLENNDLWPLTNMAVLSCRETHNSIAAECVTGYFAAALYAALRGLSKTDICAYAERGPYDDNEAHDQFWLDNVDLLVNRWRKKGDGEELKDLGGYIVDAFAVALWGFVNSDSFEEGMLKVIRLGGDTDTNAAIYGQLAGAYYGYEAIPKEWRDGVFLSEELVQIADRLLAMPECPVIMTRFEDDKYFKEAK
jgi:ADP-ribosyl-[dinitrogen reductase] hydrolase